MNKKMLADLLIFDAIILFIACFFGLKAVAGAFVLEVIGLMSWLHNHS